MYTGIKLLLHSYPFISSFFFLSNFQTLIFLVTRFTGTVRPRRLNGTHMDRGCIVYTGVRLLLLICRFISSFFFLANFQTLKIFVTFFSGTVRSRRLKIGRTWYTRGQWVDVLCIPESGCCLFVPLFLHFSFSPIFKHYKFLSHFS